MESFKFWITKKENKAQDYGRFVISSLPSGFGHTFGNSLRRVLLGYIPGIAITQIRVKGANHPFALLKGVKEDLIDVIMNIKQIRIRSEKDKPFRLELNKKGPGEVKAGDIKTPTGVEIANPDLVLAHLANRQSELKIDFEAKKDAGYSLAEENKSDKVRWIPIDAIYSPVTKATYQVREMRVGKKKGMNELELEIWTDATISPSSALKQAAQTLASGFSLIVKPVKKEAKSVKKKDNNDNLSLYLEELDLPLRLVNALKKSGFKKLADFEGMKKADLVKVKNVGEKSFQQLAKVLANRGVNLED
ncbi:MAG: DNA-directed RNA polymerase subunit alpha [Candidatus Shapirobacteria bacterium]